MKKWIGAISIIFFIADPFSFADDFVLVEGGTFSMGSTEYLDEGPVHEVTLNSFYMSKFEVTFAEYDEFCEDTGRSRTDDKGMGRGIKPAICISWYDAVEYCNWLSIKEGLQVVYTIEKSGEDSNNTNKKDNIKWIVTCDFNANGYRLPTEAEWEFAAKGGILSKGYKFSGSNDPDEVAWYSSTNIDFRTRPVGQKKPNELGLFDMSGNVFEWCWDWYGEEYYEYSLSVNPKGPSSGSQRVMRGGSIDDSGLSMYCTIRWKYQPHGKYLIIGFRPVRSKTE